MEQPGEVAGNFALSERPRFVTTGYGRHRSQWVNMLLIAKSINNDVKMCIINIKVLSIIKQKAALPAVIILVAMGSGKNIW